MFFPIVADQTLEPRTPHPVSRPSTAQQSCKTKQEVSNDLNLSQIPGLFQPGAGKWLDRILDLYCQLPRASDGAMLSVLSVRLSERIEIPFCSDLRSIVTTTTVAQRENSEAISQVSYFRATSTRWVASGPIRMCLFVGVSGRVAVHRALILFRQSDSRQPCWACFSRCIPALPACMFPASPSFSLVDFFFVCVCFLGG